MRSYGAAALLLLAFVTECLCAQRSRQRGPIRTVPVAADIKRVIDFDCPEEFGYYPHPTDCTLYYVCVFGGALLESCTGGLMYSHELQTCDWPRNVGCDAASAAGGDEIERLPERERRPPPPPPPRRTPPPPPPRVQPNPIVTSRGQPKFNREEYEKQQQLYADVDDLPPVEEIENDRQQRVYRGQPSTIGQVQKDRDGYSHVNSGRNYNPNIIPASVSSNNGKIPTLTFSSQVDDRRSAVVTQSPQSYSDNEILTDSQHDRQNDTDTNDIETNDIPKSRRKRDVVNHTSSTKTENVTKKPDEISDKNDESMEYFDIDDGNNRYGFDDFDRGKRQVRYYYNNKNPSYKNPGKTWSASKPIKYIEINQPRYPSGQNSQRLQYTPIYNNNNNYYETTRRPALHDSSAYSSANPFVIFPGQNNQDRPFRASSPDFSKGHSSLSSGTQVITKSPPISALNHNGSPYSITSEGFFGGNSYRNDNQYSSVTSRPPPQSTYKDSSLLPSTVVTGKPVSSSTHRAVQNKAPESKPSNDYYEDSEEDYSSEEDDDDRSFPKPPYDFKAHDSKYHDIENPFANPNFDFDAFLHKLSNGQYVVRNRENEKNQHQNDGPTSNRPTSMKANYVDYKGMSTPTPFGNSEYEVSIRPSNKYMNHPRPPSQQSNVNVQAYSNNPDLRDAYVDASRPKIKPPNFNDNRELPITYSFNRPINLPQKPNINQKEENNNSPVTQKPYIFLTATASPIVFSSPKQQYFINSEKVISVSPYGSSTGKPYTVSSIKPANGYKIYEVTTANPLTTLANKQLQTLQSFWGNVSTEATPARYHVTIRPSTTPDLARLKNLFAQAISSSPRPYIKNQNILFLKDQVSSITTAPPKRRPIPKPSPEMNDYYYDDDETYEPLVKPKYMPSTEIKPQRPPMAQNYKEYDDDDDEDFSAEQKLPLNSYNNQDSFIKQLEGYKNTDGKIPVPVLDFSSSTPKMILKSSFKPPNVSSIEMNHRPNRNKTMHTKKPNQEHGPNTLRPPKFLNQTTLRAYTLRHRLAKPTVAIETVSTSERTKGRLRHKNIVAQMLTTPHDNHNQETRVTKAKHDVRTNSLEPTESVLPYSPSPRPKMLYNAPQNYTSNQFDPYYVYDEDDDELYKDTDYVQQYNTASVRPVAQQTFRATTPALRRPVESYTPRPTTSADYDNVLLQGQISNQNEYDQPIRTLNRGDGNDLGYDHHPSSVRTNIYEATPRPTPSTTPQTTSTSTTTQRPTTAPSTEAMTQPQYSPRSSTDENPIPSSDPSSDVNNSDISVSLDPIEPPTQSPVINFSSLAKPFEKTGNLRRLEETVPTTENIYRGRPYVTNNNNDQSVEVVRSELSNKDNKNIVSLTTGFSIRRNSNNSNNPYTLTVLTRPIGDYDKSPAKNPPRTVDESYNNDSDLYYYGSDDGESSEKVIPNKRRKINQSRNELRRKDAQLESRDEFDIPINVKPISRPKSKQRVKSTTPATTTKYYLKSIIQRPTPFSRDITIPDDFVNNNDNENQKLSKLIDAGLQNAQVSNQRITTESANEVRITPKRLYKFNSQEKWYEPTAPSLKLLATKEIISTTPTTYTTTQVTSPVTLANSNKNSKPSYYSYLLEDDFVPDETTEVLASTVRNVFKAFFSNKNDYIRSSTPALVQYTPASSTSRSFTTTTTTTTTTTPPPTTTPLVVNIGFKKKPVKYNIEKPLRKTVRLQIIQDAPDSDSVTPKTYPPTTQYMTTLTTMKTTQSSTTPTDDNLPEKNTVLPFYKSKYRELIPSAPEPTEQVIPIKIENNSLKFHDIVNILFNNKKKNPSQTITDDKLGSEVYEPQSIEVESDIPSTEIQSEIASTTSTTKSTTTTTLRVIPTQVTSKSTSFPTRATRVNPAIKLAASIPGSGQRSYQSSSNCSPDNSLQANPKCNQIKQQRPAVTRGRGSAHYSTLSGNESPQSPPNRGTPPTRSRPTLKPSTSIVTRPTEFVDIYGHPPNRPAAVYPQPTPDKTAAKCRKDVCLLPDCYCGGKDIPGDLPLEQVPQIVLLTFDDSVNDLNKVLYSDLFEKGRVNPNGCPISATFYVSHEWTDYSQVQNLYSAGHEMASHTISHSFGEQFSQKKWNREVGGQREILAAYGGVKLEDVRGMRAPFLSIGGNKMFKMLYDSNFTYDSSMPVYENRPPSWPYTLDYKLFHDCMIPPCPTKSYPGVWEVPMVMWQDLNGGRCSMGDACANPPEAEGVYKMLLKNFDRHYTTNRAPFGLYYHAAWFTQPHHKEGFIMFLDFINQMKDVWLVTNWQALQWVRDPTPISRLNSFQPFQCNYQDRPKKCNNPKVCNLWHKSGVRYMRTCQPCPEVYPWTGKTGIRSSRIDNDNGE